MTALRTMSLDWPDKRPDEVLDYAIDLTDDLLTGEHPVGMSVRIRPSGAGELAVAGHSPAVYVQDSSAVVWLSGGQAGRVHLIEAVVETDQGRRFSYVVSLAIDETLAAYPLAVPASDGFGDEATWGRTAAAIAFRGAGRVSIAG